MRGAVLGVSIGMVVSGCAPDVEHLFASEPVPPTVDPKPVCSPGQKTDCTCPGGGVAGVRTCLDDGSGYGECLGCPSATSSSSSSRSSSSASVGAGGQGGDGGAPGQGGDGGAGMGGAGGGDGGSGPECVAPEDCPGEDTPCAQRACEAGKCGTTFTPAGPLADQMPGDCLERRCDGAGRELTVSAPEDVADDGNECTADTCTESGPMHTPIATGTPCSAGLCQNSACVQYIPVRCQTQDDIYIGCDGNDSWPWTILIYVSDMNGELCHSQPGEARYCPPGVACSVLTGDGVWHDGTCL